MSLYAIGDLHLSLSKSKPMDIFGDNWKNHHLKIKENWLKKIKNEDTVLICGDVSWAMTMQEFQADFDFIKQLNGRKFIISGNHDYWWGSTQKLNCMDSDIHFIKNNFFGIESNGIAVCGTRGWLCPNDTLYTPHDEKIYKRECNRLKASLMQAQTAGYNDFIVMLHYPPVNDKCEPSDFQKIIEEFNVKTVVYGHLHSNIAHKTGIKGNVNGVSYHLVSADYIDFDPLYIGEML